YWSFISYSHKDESWARWVHEALETYSIPRALVGRSTQWGTVSRRLYPVYRDRDEFEASSDLGQRVKQALQVSRSLIVICSPHAAASKWVAQEIEAFIALGRRDRILCLVVAGEPSMGAIRTETHCFPAPLYLPTQAETATSTEYIEPLAADVRP